MIFSKINKIKKQLQIFFLSFVLVFSFMVLIAPQSLAHADNGTAICSAQSDPSKNIGTCINRIYVIALAAGGVIAVGIFVIAGYLYMSGGNGVKTATTMITSAITGLIILFSAFLFLNTINPDLTSFTGLTLPDVTCGAGNSLCAAPSSSLSGGTSGTAGNTNAVVITAAVSSDHNVQLTATLNGQSGSGTYTWQWTSNGTILTDAAGNPANTASIDTTMDNNSAGPHTDAVTATATAAGTPPSTFSGTSTFTITFDANGNATSVSTVSSGTNATFIIDGYNLTSYATSPNFQPAITKILSSVQSKNLSAAQDITNYMQSITSSMTPPANTPLTGDMVLNSAKNYGEDKNMIITLMQNDSSFGTLGTGSRTHNPGNVGNNDTGQQVDYGTWPDGVDAVAGFLASHHASQ